jgi:hypothetical protein
LQGVADALPGKLKKINSSLVISAASYPPLHADFMACFSERLRGADPL